MAVNGGAGNAISLGEIQAFTAAPTPPAFRNITEAELLCRLALLDLQLQPPARLVKQ